MKKLTLQNIAIAVGGTYVGKQMQKSLTVSAITTDSREVDQGSLFVPIAGNRVDGHDFIKQVMEKGALCTLSERDLPGVSYPYIRVESSLQAVKDIAEFYLQQLQIPVVGVTGSVGKTSTKEMIAAVLEQKYKVLKTQGNFNNELGLPLTVFNLRENDEIAVLEMGISEFGEMHRLAKVARPDTCVITNIGQCHLENLKSRDGVLKAKTEIFDYLKADGKIILNGDDDKLASIRSVKNIEPLFFGITNQTEIFADQIENHGLKGISCRIHVGDESFTVLIPIPGQHMVYNALAGTAVGYTYGLSIFQIREGIQNLHSLSGRFHIIETQDYTIIDDCYNASPISMKASLEVLQDALGRKVAILGDMGELGADENALHEEVGMFAGQCNIDQVICIGPLSVYLAAGVKKINPDMKVIHMETKEEFLCNPEAFIKKGDTLLVKASHFMQFERIVAALGTVQK